MPGQLSEATIRLFSLLFASVKGEVANRFQESRSRTLGRHKPVMRPVPAPENLVSFRIEAAAKHAPELAVYATD